MKEQEKTPDDTIDIVTSLKIQCLSAGTPLSEVCRRAGVHRTTIEYWKRKKPKSIQMLEDIQKALGEIKAGGGSQKQEKAFEQSKREELGLPSSYGVKSMWE